MHEFRTCRVNGGAQIQIAQLKKETEDFKKIGDMIYAEYGEIDALIKEVREKKWKVQDKRILEMKKAERKIIIEL